MAAGAAGEGGGAGDGGEVEDGVAAVHLRASAARTSGCTTAIRA